MAKKFQFQKSALQQVLKVPSTSLGAERKVTRPPPLG